MHKSRCLRWCISWRSELFLKYADLAVPEMLVHGFFVGDLSLNNGQELFEGALVLPVIGFLLGVEVLENAHIQWCADRFYRHLELAQVVEEVGIVGFEIGQMLVLLDVDGHRQLLLPGQQHLPMILQAFQAVLKDIIELGLAFLYDIDNADGNLLDHR